MDYGDRGTIECELLILVREYRISWARDNRISAELAKLRWERKWTLQRIADHMGMSYASVHMRLGRIGKSARTRRKRYGLGVQGN